MQKISQKSQNLSKISGFQNFFKYEISQHLGKQKIDITRLIFKIQDSNFTCKRNFYSSISNFGMKAQEPLFSRVFVFQVNLYCVIFMKVCFSTEVSYNRNCIFLGILSAFCYSQPGWCLYWLSFLCFLFLVSNVMNNWNFQIYVTTRFRIPQW